MASKEITTVAVIGVSRGIGKELVKQLAELEDSQVITSIRLTRTDLEERPNVKFITLDITNESSVTEAVSGVSELDILIINAAMGSNDTLLGTSSDDLFSYLNTNVVGPSRVIIAFLLALLAKQTRKIIVISSTLGSNQLEQGKRTGLNGPYSVSKAALNMLANALSLHTSFLTHCWLILAFYLIGNCPYLPCSSRMLIDDLMFTNSHNMHHRQTDFEFTNGYDFHSLPSTN
ncbi:hypothetical protein VTL71DRAFT_13240 [Oculimacula yallundae]|uniref:Uncharacterized protein n=1 Tax=Oculimacula yallundae TaxID=86028 RepID=A0ABR4CKD0_9HELO